MKIIKLLLIILVFNLIACEHILNTKTFYQDNSVNLEHKNITFFEKENYYSCMRFYTSKKYKLANECFYFAYLNAEEQKEAALSILYELKSAYDYGAYNYVVSNFNKFEIYKNEFEGLNYDVLLTLAKALKKQIKGIDRNFYPNAKNIFIILDNLRKKGDKLPKSIHDEVLYNLNDILILMEKHEIYVANFYGRTDHLQARDKRLKTAETIKNIRLKLNKFINY